MKRIFMYTISNLQRDARQLMDKAMQSYNLSRYEWFILLILVIHNGSSSQATLKGYMGIDDSYLSKILDKIEKKGLIERIIDPNDRRSRLVQTATDGLEISKTIFSSAMKINDDMLSVLNHNEREQLLNLLNKVHSSIS